MFFKSLRIVDGKLDIVFCTCNLSTQKTEQKDIEFQASLEQADSYTLFQKTTNQPKRIVLEEF
jgi:hypothetical protein